MKLHGHSGDSPIGRKVTVTVDRPLGSFHPEYPDLYYPLNYGYIQGITGGDGEEQDAYILGVTVPVKSFSGVVIAVIHRFNDVEDKWVVVPEGCNYTETEILQQVSFQEKYFKISIIMA